MSAMILTLIIVVILSIIGWICLFCDKDIIAFTCFILAVGIWIVASSYMSYYDTKNTPTALDVYRGKTTLEITYRDSVAIDSTVVYKVK